MSYLTRFFLEVVMEEIFAQFLKDKTYICNVTPKTISFYLMRSFFL